MKKNWEKFGGKNLRKFGNIFLKNLKLKKIARKFFGKIWKKKVSKKF